MPEQRISPEDTRKMQLVGLKMVKYFDAFCKKNGLTYFLCGGCCIGAVRGKAFVPWDDDVDIFMKREDYEKLKRLWINTEAYSLQYPTETLETANQFATLHDNHTTFIKSYQKDLDMNHGICMDILPLDGCPTGLHRKLQKLNACLYSLYIVGKAPENHGKAVYLAGKLLLSLTPSYSVRYRLWRHFEKKMSAYPISECSAITELCSGPHYMQNEYPKEAFEKALYVPFEDTLLPIPSGYDTYLSMAFGSYMDLPPEGARVCHHAFECLDTENSYLNYKGIFYAKHKA